jgi:ribonuclease D
MPTLPLLIERQTDLNVLCDVVANCNIIGLDTEFVRTRTYAPQLGLVQIAADDTAVCVDPLADLNFEQFWELLFDPARAIIMHSATQDLEVMWFHRGAIVHNLIDTQLCAALLGYQPQIGYAGLVADLAGVSLSKEQTRTDWTRRPLTTEQLDYAAKDVVYLGGMHNVLRDRLNALGRYDWALEDSAALCDLSLYQPDIENAWQRIKSIPFMQAEQQARARRLAAWREQRAVELDKPRKWIMDDKALAGIANANPRDAQTLATLDDVPAALAKRQADDLLAAVARGNTDYANNPENYQQEIPDRDRDKAQSKLLTKLIRAKAEELQIPAEVLASRRDINALLRGETKTRILSGWRYEVIGKSLEAALAAMASQ